MNKDQVKGRFEETKGKIKEVAGKVLGNRFLEARGDAEQMVGTTRKNFGDAKSQANKA
jgi:uncharacterized protein YjbJ (UPF0337 family)